MLTIRAGRGLGDALYLQAVCRHLVKQGKQLEIRSDWPDVFKPLGDMVRVVPFGRNPKCDIVAHYTKRKGEHFTSQFEDCCIAAEIEGPVEFRLDWETRARFETDKPVVLVALPRQPMDRKDGYGRDLLPDLGFYQRVLNRLAGRCFLVQVGAGKPLAALDGLDLDLANRTTIDDLLDLANGADGLLGYCSFFIPLAESFTKPLLCVWSRRGLWSDSAYIKQCTPKKILHRPTSKAIMDNCQDLGAVDEFYIAVSGETEVHGKDSRAGGERAGIAL